MSEQFEEVYTYISTQGDGPAIDAALALAKTALQPGANILPSMTDPGDMLIASENGVVEVVSWYPYVLNKLAADLAAMLE